MVRKNTNMPMAIEDKNNDVDRDQLSEEAKMLATEKKHVRQQRRKMYQIWRTRNSKHAVCDQHQHRTKGSWQFCQYFSGIVNKWSYENNMKNGSDKSWAFQNPKASLVISVMTNGKFAESHQ